MSEILSNSSPERGESETKPPGTMRDIEQIAKATGRVVDDKDVLKLNLKLKYDQYNEQLAQYKNMVDNGTAPQTGIKQDVATAKRELEEAMYLYDPKFAEYENKLAQLTAEYKSATDPRMKRDRYERILNLKGQSRTSVPYQDNPNKPDYIKFEHPRHDRAEELTGRLKEITGSLDGSEILNTFNLNKNMDYTPGPLADRRRTDTVDWNSHAEYSEQGVPVFLNGDSIHLEPKAPRGGVLAKADPEPNPILPENPESPVQDEIKLLPAPQNIESDPTPEPDAPTLTDEPEIAPETVVTPPPDETRQLPAPEDYNMVAVDVDLTVDADMHARELARRRYEEEMHETGNFFKRAIKKGLRHYKFEKYYQEFRERILDGQELNVDQQNEAVRGQMRDDIIDKFVLSYQDELRRELIETASGENANVVDENDPIFARSRHLVELYAGGHITPDEFQLRLEALRGHMRERWQNQDGLGELTVDNLGEVAENARVMVEHGQGLADVMSRFAMVRGEARTDVRTEEHRTSIDRAVRAFESVKSRIPLLNMIPTEVMAGAASVGIWAATSGGSKLARIAGLGAGAGVIGVVAGVKEHLKVTEQRALYDRETARGREYTGETRRERRDRFEEFRYDERMNVSDAIGALDGYEANLVEQIEAGNIDEAQLNDFIDNVALIQIRKEFSAQQGIDLLVFDNEQSITGQRIDLGLAQSSAKDVIDRAMAAMPPDRVRALFGGGNISVDNLVDERTGLFADMLADDMGVHDRAFARYRRAESVKTGLRAAGVSLVAGEIFQEVGAFFNDQQTGLVEQLTNGGVNDTIDARNSALLGIVGVGVNDVRTISPSTSAFETPPGVKLTPDQLQELDSLESQGFEVVDNSYLTYETIDTPVEIDGRDGSGLNDYFHNRGIEPIIDHAESGGDVTLDMNGTNTPDFDELRGYVDTSGGTLKATEGFLQSDHRGDLTMLFQTDRGGQAREYFELVLDKNSGEYHFPGMSAQETMDFFNSDGTPKGNNVLIWGMKGDSGDIHSVASIAGNPAEDISVNTQEKITKIVNSYTVHDRNVPVDWDAPFAFGWYRGKELGVPERQQAGSESDNESATPPAEQEDVKQEDQARENESEPKPAPTERQPGGDNMVSAQAAFRQGAVDMVNQPAAAQSMTGFTRTAEGLRSTNDDFRSEQAMTTTTVSGDTVEQSVESPRAETTTNRVSQAELNDNTSAIENVLNTKYRRSNKDRRELLRMISPDRLGGNRYATEYINAKNETVIQLTEEGRRRVGELMSQGVTRQVEIINRLFPPR
jgi:hypothetical protein